MNKYEQLIEHIINDETDKARELFHTIVVEKSRDIYENLIDEQDLAEVGGNEVEDLVDEITIDEQGISEEEDEEGAMDFDADGEVDPHEEEHGDMEDRVMDLEDALDELKAEFDALMAGEEAEEEKFPGIHGEEEPNPDEAPAPEEMYEADEDPEMVREYVEKVASPANTEGAAVGTGKSVAVNKTSPVAGKNDMGGKAVNVTAGGTASHDGTTPNSSVKPKGELVGKVANSPGAHTKLSPATKAPTADGTLAGHDGRVPQNVKSPVGR